MTILFRLTGAVRGAFLDATHVSLDFFKVLVPLIITLKILAELDWIRYLALPLEPIMLLTGLPPDLGIAWATGLMVNFYSALIVFVSLLPGLPELSAEQTTTLATMMLLAHSLPAEGRIAQQCGVSFMSQTIIRLVVAVVAGVIVHTSCLAFGWLDRPAAIVFQAAAPERDLVRWGLGELRNLGSIFCIIFAVMLIQRGLKYFRISDLLGIVLNPLLRLLGLSSAAATTIVIGLVTGLVYGSGTIIKEARSGTLTTHEIFTCVTLMGLCHALIEDTLLMTLIGAHLGGILFLRLGISLLVCAGLNALYVRGKGVRQGEKS